MGRITQWEVDRCNALRATAAMSEVTFRHREEALTVEVFALAELRVPEFIAEILSMTMATMWLTWQPGDMLLEVLLIDEPRYEDSDQVRMGFSHPGGIIVLSVVVPAVLPWEEWTPVLRLVLAAAHEMMHAIRDRLGEAVQEDAPYSEQEEERITWVEAFDLVRAAQPERWGALRDGAAQHEAHWIAVAEAAWASERRVAPEASRYTVALSALRRA